MADRHKVLVIDNDPRIRRYVGRILGAYGCEVTTGGAEILSDTIARWQPDCIVLGLDAVPDPGKILAQLTQSEPRAPLLCLVADCNPQALLTAIEAGADDYLVKPFVSNDLEFRMRRLLHRKSAKPVRPVQLNLGKLRVDVVLRRATADGLAFP
jgi:DNA-binding response OmpR family regulator